MKSVSATRRKIRAKRKVSIRKKVNGTAERPRVSVFRSHKNIYAQLVDDDLGATLMATDAGTAAQAEAPEGVDGKCAQAYSVGRALAEKAKERIERIEAERKKNLR